MIRTSFKIAFFSILFLGKCYFPSLLAQTALSPTENNFTKDNTNTSEKLPEEKVVQDEINPFSLRRIPKSHIAFQKTVWLRLSFKEKTNLPLWYAGHQLSKFLIENALNDKIKAYKNDNLKEILPKEELLESIKIYSENSLKNKVKADSILDLSEVSVLEIREDWLLDSRHSRVVQDVLAFTLILPHNAKGNDWGMTRKIASFSYKEIIETLFRPLKEDYVVYEKKLSNNKIPNLETLIDTRFFHGYLVKYDNFEDEYFEDRHSSAQDAFFKSKQYEEILIEFESCLWEY